MQLNLAYDVEVPIALKPLKSQLLKWIGNKQRFATEIISFFPQKFNKYYEPFLGSGAVLGNLAPSLGFASDIYKPLIEIWQALHDAPELLLEWYSDRWAMISKYGKEEAYKTVLASFNAKPNGADFVFLTRACYGGVIRFRQNDGYMSTPCGAHNPIPPNSFSRRIDEWSIRTKNTRFECCDFSEAMSLAKTGDLVYCDPPYTFSQNIVYGAQAFKLEDLFDKIDRCKSQGVFVALSIDGTKKSGDMICNLPIPKGLFEREVFVNTGRSMLKRFQMEGSSLEKELVTDRLLLTY
jgi:DNA adenine methylase